MAPSHKPDHWRGHTRLGEALSRPAPDAAGLGASLALLGKLLATRGLGVTTGEAQVVGAWGLVPSTYPPAGRAAHAWVGRPLVVEKTEYGCLWLRRGAWESDPDRLKLLTAAEHLLATAVRAQSIVQAERDKRALAEVLEHVSQVLTSSLDVEQVLSRILDELAGLVPYDSALVMLLEGGRLHLHAQRGYKRLARQGRLADVTFVPEETARVLDVLTGTEPVIVTDIREVPGWLWVPFSTHIRSWMGVPLRVHDRAIGLFSIDKAEPDFFTRRHGVLAAAVAPHAAIAIENARLYQDLKAAEAQLRQLSTHVIEVQEAERQRIGRELHDHAGQAILAMRAELQLLARQLPPDNPAARAQFDKLDSILKTTARDLRLLAHELRSHLLDELGLVSALQQQVRDVGERFGLRAELVTTGPITRHSPAVELAAFRIAQEALTNVARHAQARAVRVELQQTRRRLRLAIEDDGVGFAVDARRTAGTIGLIGMRERAVAANGVFSLTSGDGRGTRIVVEFPMGGRKP